MIKARDFSSIRLFMETRCVRLGCGCVNPAYPAYRQAIAVRLRLEVLYDAKSYNPFLLV